MVGTIGDGRANPNAGAVHLLYLGLNATGDLLPSVKDWRKITTGVFCVVVCVPNVCDLRR